MLLVAPILFIAILSILVLLALGLRTVAGFRSTTEFRHRAEASLERSGWSSLRLESLGFQGCIQVLRCEDGFLVRLFWIFGGGYLWLPRSRIRRVTRDRCLVWTTTTVVLCGQEYTFSGSAGDLVWRWWQDEQADETRMAVEDGRPSQAA